MLDICVSFRLHCNVMFNAKESICIAVTRKKLQSKLISLMMVDNITGLDTQFEVFRKKISGKRYYRYSS